MRTGARLIGTLDLQPGLVGKLYLSYRIRLKVIRPVLDYNDSLTVTKGSVTLETGEYDYDAGAYWFEIPEYGTWHVSSSIVSGGDASATSYWNDDVKVSPGGPTVYTSEHLLAYRGQAGLEVTDWDVIARVAAMGKTEDYFWSVGDTKSLDFGDGTTFATIIGFDLNGEPGVYWQLFTSVGGSVLIPEITNLARVDEYYNESLTDGTRAYNMNHAAGEANAATYGGWAACDLRYDILGSTDSPPSEYNMPKTAASVGYDPTPLCAVNPVQGTIMQSLPGTLRAVMAPMTVWSDNTGTGYIQGTDSPDHISATKDFLPLMDEYEIFGECTNTNYYLAEVQTQAPYYADGGSTVRQRVSGLHNDVGDACRWLTRSPDRTLGSGSWTDVNPLGSTSTRPASHSHGLAPMFRVWKEGN